MFAKSNTCNNILGNWTKFKCGSCSYSAMQLPIKPSKLIKNIHFSVPFLAQCIPMTRCIVHKPSFSGPQLLSRPQEKRDKLCAPSIAFYPIFVDAQTCRMESHKLYPWTTGSMQFAIANATPMLCILFLAPSHTFLWIRSLHSSGITFLGRFTSAPFCSKTSTTSLCPFSADMCKGVAPSWWIQYIQQMQTHKKKMVGKQMLHKIYFLPFFFACKKTKTHIWQCQIITHLHHCLKKHALSIGTTY